MFQRGAIPMDRYAAMDLIKEGAKVRGDHVFVVFSRVNRSVLAFTRVRRFENRATCSDVLIHSKRREK